MRSQSKEHYNIVKKISKLFGKVYKEKGLDKGGYYPDIELDDVDIEVESLNKIREYKIKSNKWNKKKGKILIIFIPKQIKEVFDAVMFWE